MRMYENINRPMAVNGNGLAEMQDLLWDLLEVAPWCNIHIHQLENKSPNIVPSLSSTLTEKLRSRILSQTGLSPVTKDDADYDMTGSITTYAVSVTGATGVQTASKNRLTISVLVTFKNRINEKSNFSQTFTRFADFDASQL